MRARALLAILLVAACGPPPRAVVLPRQPSPVRMPPAPPPPPIVIEQIVPPRPVPRSPEERITLVATNADVREILPILAEAAKISMVMDSTVRGRVSVNFRDVTATHALMSVIEQAGLTIGQTSLVAPYGPVRFHDLPVNVNKASAATISARFDVSTELAEWIVKARKQ